MPADISIVKKTSEWDTASNSKSEIRISPGGEKASDDKMMALLQHLVKGQSDQNKLI